MPGHLLRDLQPPSIFEVVGNPRGSKAVTANLRFDSSLRTAAPDHLMDVGLVQWARHELAFSPGAKERGVVLATKTGRF